MTCRQVKRILKNLGFAFSKQEGSHEKWVRTTPSRRYVVTVDCPKQPFSKKLLKWMALQAGVTLDELYGALDD